MKKILSTLAAAALLAACTASVSAIDNQLFKITELNGTEYVSLGEQPAAIAFSDGVCNATVGGNGIFAEYAEGKDGALTFCNGGATKMMVPEEYREDEFIAAFNAIASYKVDGETVVFLDAEGNELIKAVK